MNTEKLGNKENPKRDINGSPSEREIDKIYLYLYLSPDNGSMVIFKIVISLTTGQFRHPIHPILHCPGS